MCVIRMGTMSSSLSPPIASNEVVLAERAAAAERGRLTVMRDVKSSQRSRRLSYIKRRDQSQRRSIHDFSP